MYSARRHGETAIAAKVPADTAAGPETDAIAPSRQVRMCDEPRRERPGSHAHYCRRCYFARPSLLLHALAL